MPLILPANTLSAGGYEVANSCRFNDGDGAYLTKTFDSTTNRKIWTYSLWLKKCFTSAEQHILSTANGTSNPYMEPRFQADDTLHWYEYDGSYSFQLVTNRKFRDPSAWYHIVLAVDTSQGAEANRLKMYINGVQETSFSTATYPSLNLDTSVNVSGYLSTLGSVRNTTANNFDGYMAEVVFIDGLQLTPTSFGEFNEDSPTIWQPIDVSGLTFGDNGFYLDFEDSDNLGDDESGNTDDFTENNLAAVDQATDTPTNNFCTLNPLDNYFNASTFSEGNLKIVTSSGNYSFNTGTIGVAAGKWYWEVFITSNSTEDLIGITKNVSTSATNYLGENAGAVGHNDNGNAYVAGSNNSYGTSYTTNDVIGVALDLTNNKLYFSKNGTFQNSGDPTSGATGTGAISIDAISGDFYFPGVGEFEGSASGTFSANFGNPPYANSSDAADANGYGAFEFAPPSGYLALCTKNLGSTGG